MNPALGKVERVVVSALVTLAATACATNSPVPSVVEGPSPLPPPLIRPPAGETYALVTANSDAARVLAGLDARRLVATPADVSRVDLLAGSPGYAWRIGPRDHLHIHAYRDRQWAAAGAQRFVSTAMARSQIIDWAGKPHLFQCGTAVALYLGETPQALNVLTYLCGAPVWRQ